MSKLSDYSKFDHLDSDSDDEPAQAQCATVAPTAAPTNENTGTVASAPTPPTATASSTLTTTSIMQQHPTLPQRYTYLHNGSEAVYEWEQSMQEVVIYIAAPDFLLRDPKLINCQITSNHLRLGQQQQVANQQPYFLDEDIWQTANVKDSTWCIEDDKYICIYLQKANKGIVWEAALKGVVNTTNDTTTTTTPAATVTLNPTQLQDVQQRLMLERFQEENPGMDFRDATFNGSVPDPRTFMGGVKHD